MNKPNIILIVLDSLRKDMMYNSLEEMLGFRMLLQDGVKLSQVISPSSWTVPSHASIFLGNYPSEHGVHHLFGSSRSTEHIGQNLKTYSQNNNTLPRVLQRQGYQTLSITSNLLLSKGTGFENGFDSCLSVPPFTIIEDVIAQTGDSMPVGDTALESTGTTRDGRGRGSLRLAKEFLHARAELKKMKFPRYKGGRHVIESFDNAVIEEPFFAYLNLMEAHEPYGVGYALPPHLTEPFQLRALRDVAGVHSFSTSYVSRTVAAYTQEIKLIDGYIQSLIATLRAKHLYENTLVVVTSDHGQALKERNYMGHAGFLYDEIIEVPLVIKFPNGFSARNTDQGSSLVDMKNFLLPWADGEAVNFPSSDISYSEAYGFNQVEVEQAIGPNVEAYWNVKRKCILKGGAKLTVNGTHGTIEELLIHGRSACKETKQAIANELLEELRIFVGNEDFELPATAK